MSIHTDGASRESQSDPLAYCLARIQEARIEREPFPHIIVEGLFPDSFFRSLLENLPEKSQLRKVEYPGTGHGRTAATYHDYGYACEDLSKYPFFRDVHAWLESDSFSRTLLSKFSSQLEDGFWPIPIEKHRHFANGATDFTSVFDLQIDLPGYAIAPHPDTPSKIVTYQLFLVGDDSLRDYGTLFCRPKDGRRTTRRSWAAGMTGWLLTRAAKSLRLTKTSQYLRLERSALGLTLGVGENQHWLPWSLVDVVKVAPGLPNCFMAFPPNATSYHAVRLDIPPSAKRQERPVVRGFIRSGSNTQNWIAPKNM